MEGDPAGAAGYRHHAPAARVRRVLRAQEGRQRQDGTGELALFEDVGSVGQRGEQRAGGRGQQLDFVAAIEHEQSWSLSA